jgi:hypothetical protein
MKFKYIVIVLSLSSILILYLLSGLSQPTAIPLSTISSNEGKTVLVNGIVTDYQTTTFGSQIITIRDTNSTDTPQITLYIEGEIVVEYGDLIQATGVVQQYNNNWEITVSNPHFVIILQQWGNHSFPLWQLAKNPIKYVDTNVNVTGVVDTLTSTTFYLTDPEEACSLPVTYLHSSSSPFSEGDLVAVEARFLYNQETLSYVLKIIDATQGITVVERANHD